MDSESGRPTAPVLTQQQYLLRWAALHGRFDLENSRTVRIWLNAMYTVAAPIARIGVGPTVVTAGGVAMASAALAAALVGGGWLFAAAGLVVLSALLDGVDGAVAVVSERETAWGFVIDTVADRCSDLLFLACLIGVGAPWPLVAAMMIATMLQESARARADAAGLTERVSLTVWERPSRVITVVLIVVTAGLFPAAASVTTVLGSLVGAALATIGVLQLLVTTRRRLLLRHVQSPPMLGHGHGH